MQPVTTYNDAAGGPDKGDWALHGKYNKGDVVTDPNDHKRYAAKSDLPNDLTSPSSDSGNWEGDTNSLQGAPSPGPDRGLWQASHAYAQGDVVEDKDAPADPANLQHYRAKVNNPNTSTHPRDNSAEWETVSTGGSAQGSADEVASGNDDSGGAPGYKNVLSGTSAPAPNAWVSGHAYVSGDKVLFNGHHYKAKHTIVSTTIDPATNTSEWFFDDGEYSTNGRISDDTAGSKSAIGSHAPGTTVASSALHTTVPAGTSAQLNGTIHAGHSVSVIAGDNLSVTALAGAVAGGLVGIGAAIEILNVKSATEAKVGAGTQITAGNGGGDNVTVHAGMDETVNAIAFTGTGGFVSVGAQVAVLNDQGTQNAHIDDGAAIHQAGGGVDVTTHSQRNINNFAIGVGTGAGAIGAAVGTNSVTGNASAAVLNVLVGDVNPIGYLNVALDDHLTAATLAISVQGGIGAGLAGAIAFADLGGTAAASSGAHGRVGGGGVSVTAVGTADAQANTINVATGALAVGVTVAHAKNARNVEATLSSSSNIDTTGSVLVRATGTHTAEATAPGGSAGGVTIAILIPIAIVAGHTRAEVDGTISSSTGVTVQSIGENVATATVMVIGVSVVGLTGAVADAEMNQEVEAKLKGKQNNADAEATAGSFGGIASLSIMGAIANLTGNVRAEVDGSITSASEIDIFGTGNFTSKAPTSIFSIGSFNASGSGTLAEIDGNTEANVGTTGSLTCSCAVDVKAENSDTATADSDVGGGGLVSITVSMPTAKIVGGTRAQVNGTVATSSLTVEAHAPYLATATSKPISIGLFGSVVGVKSDAEITGVVEALIGERAENAATLHVPSVNVGSGLVKVRAGSTMTATAVGDSVNAGGIVSASIILPTAKVDGKTRAYVRDGVNMHVGSLTILATDQTDTGPVVYTATSTSHVLGIGALSGAGVKADATISGTVEAFAGAPAGMAAGGAGGQALHVSGGATTVTALSQMHTTATADGTSAGAIAANVMIPTSTVGGITRAFAGEGANITDGTTLTVTANAIEMKAEATTVAISVGGFGGEGVDAHANVSGTVDAHIGAAAGATPSTTPGTISLSGVADVEAHSVMKAIATANGGGGGGANVAIMLPTANVSGTTRAYAGEGTNLTSGGLIVNAQAPTMEATATSKAVGIGLFGSVEGIRSDAEVTGTIEAFIGAQAANSVNTPAGTINVGVYAVTVTAGGFMHAFAKSDGLGAGALAIAIMLPTAHVSGTTAAYVREGINVTAASLTVQAGTTSGRVEYKAEATTHVVEIGIVGSGAGANSVATIDGVVESYVGAPAGATPGGDSTAKLTISGAVEVDAASKMTTIATADGTDAAAGISVTVMVPHANTGGTTRAYIGQGANIDPSGLTLNADGLYAASATTVAVGISGLASGTGANANAEVTGIVAAHIGAAAGTTPSGTLARVDVGSSSSTIGANSSIAATGRANGMGASVGLTISFMLPTATVSGVTRAYVGEGADVKAGTVSLNATAPTMFADSQTSAVSIGGLASIAGLKSDAKVTGISEAYIGAQAANSENNVTTSVDVGTGGTINVTAGGFMHAKAVADGTGGGAVDVHIMLPTAEVDGTTSGRVAYTAEALSTVLEISIGGGAGTSAVATVTGTVQSFLGAPNGVTRGGDSTAKIKNTGTIDVQAASDMYSHAVADGTAGGGIAVTVMIPDAEANGKTLAYAGDGTNVDAGALNITADGKVKGE